VATRKQRRRPEEVRKHTQIDQLIDRLTKHALSEKPLMDEWQVQTALTVLNNTAPSDRALRRHRGSRGRRRVRRDRNRQRR
jgi:hypothetical protein